MPLPAIALVAAPFILRAAPYVAPYALRVGKVGLRAIRGGGSTALRNKRKLGLEGGLLGGGYAASRIAGRAALGGRNLGRAVSSQDKSRRFSAAHRAAFKRYAAVGGVSALGGAYAAGGADGVGNVARELSSGLFGGIGGLLSVLPPQFKIALAVALVVGGVLLLLYVWTIIKMWIPGI